MFSVCEANTQTKYPMRRTKKDTKKPQNINNSYLYDEQGKCIDYVSKGKIIYSEIQGIACDLVEHNC